MTKPPKGAIFKIYPDTEVDTLWWGGIPNGDLCGLLLRQAGEDWKLIYRFRYHRDEKAWDSADEKSVYVMGIPPDMGVDRASDLFTEVLATAQATICSTGEDRFDLRAYPINARGDAAAAAVQAAIGRHAHAVVCPRLVPQCEYPQCVSTHPMCADVKEVRR